MDEEQICREGARAVISYVRVGYGKEFRHLVTRIFRVNGDGCITQHGLWTRSGDNNLLVGTLDGIRKRSDSSELELLLDIVPRYI